MKKKNQTGKRIWSFGIMLCLALALGCLIFTSVLGNVPRGNVERTVAATPEVSLAPDATESAEPVETPTPNPIEKIDSPAALTQTDPASGDYVNTMYFLGDSALKILNDETLLAGPEKDQQVWCPESGVMDLNLLSSVTFPLRRHCVRQPSGDDGDPSEHGQREHDHRARTEGRS